MRRLLSGLAAVGLLTAQQAHAQLECLSPHDRSAVQIAALRSQLMVLATGCQNDNSYNAFIRKYQPDLMSNERALDEIFKHKYGRRAQQEHDRFTTELANAESTAGLKLGTDFCAHNGLIFHEVMALQSPADLASYAAGKNLVPSAAEICQEVAQAPARKAVATKRH
ncbi:MAG TPA: hypothetical protein VH855_23785 [Acetobacteraceae bacterium]|jgi:hypothetical protein